MISTRSALAFLLVSLLLGCSSQTPPATKSAEPAKPEKKEAQLLTGREAFQKMYVSAHLWVADAKPYTLESVVNSESNGRDGKASIWRSGFASLSRRGLKAFLWSGSAL